MVNKTLMNPLPLGKAEGDWPSGLVDELRPGEEATFHRQIIHSLCVAPERRRANIHIRGNY